MASFHSLFIFTTTALAAFSAVSAAAIPSPPDISITHLSNPLVEPVASVVNNLSSDIDTQDNRERRDDLISDLLGGGGEPISGLLNGLNVLLGRGGNNPLSAATSHLASSVPSDAITDIVGPKRRGDPISDLLSGRLDGGSGSDPLNSVTGLLGGGNGDPLTTVTDTLGGIKVSPSRHLISDLLSSPSNIRSLQLNSLAGNKRDRPTASLLDILQTTTTKLGQVSRTFDILAADDSVHLDALRTILRTVTGILVVAVAEVENLVGKPQDIAATQADVANVIGLAELGRVVHALFQAVVMILARVHGAAGPSGVPMVTEFIRTTISPIVAVLPALIVKLVPNLVPILTELLPPICAILPAGIQSLVPGICS